MPETKTCAACGEQVTVNYPYEFKERHANCRLKNTTVPNEKCPKCAATLLYKLGKYQVFRACSRWPNCDGKISAPRGRGSASNKSVPQTETSEVSPLKYPVGTVVKDNDNRSYTITEHGYKCHKESRWHYHHTGGWDMQESVENVYTLVSLPQETSEIQNPPETQETETQETQKENEEQEMPKNTDAGQALYQLIKGSISKDMLPLIKACIQKTLEETPANKLTIEIKLDGKEAKELKGATHKALLEMLKKYKAGFRNFYLVGPAGSGKTTLAQQFAEALYMPFSMVGITAGVSESRFVGRNIPNLHTGKEHYEHTDLVEKFAEGGVYLFDEADRGDSNSMCAMNSATANGHLPVPCKEWPVVQRDANTVLVFTANTYGTGADRQYVGANQLDAAFLDRFVGAVIDVDYDQDLEKALVGSLTHGSALLSYTQTIRQGIQSNKLRRIWGTRAVLACARLLESEVHSQPLNAIKDCMRGWTKDEMSKCGVN